MLIVLLMLRAADPAVASSAVWQALVIVNGSAFAMRLFMMIALSGSYAERGLSYWLSWLSDLAAAWRLTLSTARTPTKWRGRQYASLTAET
jgi:dolichol-phosphate mannosyltransferase